MFALIHSLIATALLVVALVVIAIGSATSTSGSASTDSWPTFAIIGIGIVVVVLVYTLAVFVPTLAVIVRQLHDTGRSGWWYLIAFVPFGVIVLLVFMFEEGTRGPNRYGVDPKGVPAYAGY